MQTNTPISELRDKESVPAGCLVIFGSVFLLVGLASFWFMMLAPLSTFWSARNWSQTPCTILTATIEESHSEESTTHRAKFTYTYQYAGQRYEGDQDHWYPSSGSRQAAIARRDTFPVGKQTQCWVNPKHPEQAILDRTFRWWPALGPLLIVVPFVGLGGTIAFFGLRGLGERSAKREADARPLSPLSPSGASALVPPNSTGGGDRWAPAISSSGHLSSQAAQGAHFAGDLKSSSEPNAQLLDSLAAAQDLLDEQASVPQRLKPHQTRIARLVGFCIFAALWNGIIGVAVYGFLFKAPLGLGWGQLIAGLFLLPFVMVGIMLIVGSFYTLLSMFNPVVSVALSVGASPPGGEIDVAWEVSGGLRSLRGLKLAIVGQEWCRYVRGTDTRTDTSTFAVIPICEVNEAQDIRFGSRTVLIPQNSMHSFDAEHNKVQWSVRAQGEIAWWPDILEDFHFRVTPPQTNFADKVG